MLMQFDYFVAQEMEYSECHYGKHICLALNLKADLHYNTPSLLFDTFNLHKYIVCK